MISVLLCYWTSVFTFLSGAFYSTGSVQLYEALSLLSYPHPPPQLNETHLTVNISRINRYC